MSEIWKDIKGFEGWYKVSNKGNVKSIDRIVTQQSKYNQTIERKLKGTKIIPQDDGTGYLVVYLTKNQNRKRLYVHRLVAEAFIANHYNKPQINHKDFNRKNNTVENLEWVTRHENMLHASPKLSKPRNSKPTITGEKYITIKEGRYRFSIWHKYDKSYNTLAEAVAAREEYFNDQEHHSA